MYQELIEKYISKNYQVKTDGNVLAYEVLPGDILKVVTGLYFAQKLPLKTITAVDERKESNRFRVLYVFGVPGSNVFLVPYITLSGTEEFPSITKQIQQAAWHERKIRTFFGLEPAGHPDHKPIILHENWPNNVFPLRKDFDWQTRPAEANNTYEFQKVEGEGIYEIPVGPVHAGIIEPGHFRFSVAGEEIILLEPKLGYVHKGTEKLFEVLPLADKVRLSERVSGDTSFTHSLAFCQAVESLANLEVPERAKYLRVIFSELERLANHFNDVGFVMQDTGYSFGGATGTRLREQIMQWHERLTGSRFLRSVNTIGGVTKGISVELAQALLKDLQSIQKDFREFVDISEDSASVLNRLEGTGQLDYQIAVDHGVLGIAGRALGLASDSRVDFPYAAYNKIKFPVALEKNGDVRSRLYVRIKEIFASFGIIEQAVASLPVNGKLVCDGPVDLRKNSYGVGVAEGWRGEICYFVITDNEGKVTRVDVRDPSFINWTVLGYAGKGNVVPDFPLINKSFNLSYSGDDL